MLIVLTDVVGGGASNECEGDRLLMRPFVLGPSFFKRTPEVTRNRASLFDRKQIFGLRSVVFDISQPDQRLS